MEVIEIEISVRQSSAITRIMLAAFDYKLYANNIVVILYNYNLLPNII